MTILTSNLFLSPMHRNYIMKNKQLIYNGYKTYCPSVNRFFFLQILTRISIATYLELHILCHKGSLWSNRIGNLLKPLLVSILVSKDVFSGHPSKLIVRNSKSTF